MGLYDIFVFLPEGRFIFSLDPSVELFWWIANYELWLELGKSLDLIIFEREKSEMKIW